ncbi:DUF975 family protein [Paraclostridium ghonii]|uniref:DUF975 family protein n=1 Tax=Paraclostridium ghonii TaxID=29358 RepID=UPI002F3F1CB7
MKKGEFKIDRVQLKELSKSQLKGNWKIPVLLTLAYSVVSTILSMIQGITSSSLTYLIMFILTFGFGVFLTIGIPNFYLMFIEKKGNSSFSDVIVSKSKFVKALIYTVVFTIIVFVVTFVIFGIILGGTVVFAFSKSGFGIGFIFAILMILALTILLIIFELALMLTPYIIIEHEHLGVIDSMSLSIKMMKGNKWKFFVIGLSFIGWGILSVITLGIGFLWLIPYVMLTQANFYRDLSSKN